MKIRTIMITVAALTMALLVGCTQNQILITLEASVAATETLVATLQVAGKVSPATASQIEAAISDLPAAYRETATELASSDNTAVMAVKIAAYYSSTIAALQLLPPEAQLYATAISTSIQAFVSGLQPAQATRSIAPLGVSPHFEAKPLNAIRTRANVLELNIARLKANYAQAGNIPASIQ